MKKLATIIIATMIMINSIAVMADIPGISHCTDRQPGHDGKPCD